MVSEGILSIDLDLTSGVFRTKKIDTLKIYFPAIRNKYQNILSIDYAEILIFFNLHLRILGVTIGEGLVNENGVPLIKR